MKHTMNLHRGIAGRVGADVGPSLLCAGALLLVLGAPARAAGPTKREQAKAAVEKGETAYKLGRFEDALEDYSHAYELFPAPALLFNLGQCHKQLKNYDRAIFFFEGYLRDDPRPTSRKLAQELIAESRAELAKKEAAAAAPPAPPAPAAPEKSAEATAAVTSAPPALQAPAAPKTEPVLLSAPSTAPPSDVSPPSAQPTRWWLWAAIAAGALAAGAVAYYETGAPRTVVPEGSLGTIDRR
jgi:tetratricopeptide (TPR) repeat protein